MDLAQSDEDLIEASQRFFERPTNSLSDEELIRASQDMFDDTPMISESDEMSTRASKNQDMKKGNDERFHVANDNEIEQRATSSVPLNTQKRDKWAYNAFSSWAIAYNNRHNSERKVTPTLDKLSEDDLSFFLRIFVVEVRKLDGSEYPPNSLFHIVMGLQSYIRTTSKRNIQFLNSDKFIDFKLVLDGEMKRLTQKGLGIDVKKAEPFSYGDEEALWKARQLGDHNPRILLNTILYLKGKNFGLRCGQEHRKLKHKNSQISLEKDSTNGKEYLLYREDWSKTAQGGIKHRKIQPKEVKHYQSTLPARCHVWIYKKYLSLVPPDGHDHAFYLQCLQLPTDTCWYSRQPLGHNTLQKLIPEMCTKAGVGGRKTNHSLRATTATRLYRAGVPEQVIMERTGHRSATGLRNYTHTSEEQLIAVSDVLDGTKGPTTSQKAESTDGAQSDSDSAKCKFVFKNCVVNLHVK